MKKWRKIALALMMALFLLCTAALAEETPQPEGGKKFESNWAKMGGLIEIVYEEEGYRVSVDLFNQDDNTGTLWEYACYYVEEIDSLESISSRKSRYTMNPLTLDRTFGENEYEGIDDADKTTDARGGYSQRKEKGSERPPGAAADLHPLAADHPFDHDRAGLWLLRHRF